MDTDEKQAVVTETNTTATPVVEEGGAQEPTVEELLSEFDATEPKTEPTVKQSTSETGEVKLTSKQRGDILDELRTEIKVKEELAVAVTDIKGDLDIEDDYVEWKLNDLAKNDDRVWKAFLARNSNPKAWNAIKQNLQKELAGKYGKAPAGDDKEQIAAAVHSATQTTGGSPNDVDVKSLSSSDFQIQKAGIMERALAGR